VRLSRFFVFITRVIGGGGTVVVGLLLVLGGRESHQIAVARRARLLQRLLWHAVPLGPGCLVGFRVHARERLPLFVRRRRGHREYRLVAVVFRGRHAQQVDGRVLVYGLRWLQSAGGGRGRRVLRLLRGDPAAIAVVGLLLLCLLLGSTGNAATAAARTVGPNQQGRALLGPVRPLVFRQVWFGLAELDAKLERGLVHYLQTNLIVFVFWLSFDHRPGRFGGVRETSWRRL